MNARWILPLLLSACAAPAPPAPVAPPAPAIFQPSVCGRIDRFNVCGPVFLASQPGAEDFAFLKRAGVRTVINLRVEGELKEFDERKLAGELGFEYVSLPFGSPDELTDAVFDRARELLTSSNKAILLHCHSGNRAGAIWLARRVLDDSQSYESALAEAHTVGLATPALEQKAQDYIERHRQPSR